MKDEDIVNSYGPEFSLTEWREKLGVNILRVASILSIPAFVIGSYPMVQQGLWLQLLVNLIVVLALGLAAVCRFPVKMRTGIALSVLYALCMNVLFEVGIHGDARILFFIFILMTLLLFDLRMALISLALTCFSISAAGILLLSGIINLANRSAVLYSPITWITDMAIFLAGIGITMAGVETLLRQFKCARGKALAYLGELEHEHALLEHEQLLLEQRVAERTMELEALRQTSLEIGGQLDLDVLLRNIVDRGCSLLGTPIGGIYLVDPSSGMLILTYAQGVSPGYIGTSLAPGEGFAGKVYSTGESLVVENYFEWEGRFQVFDQEAFSGVLGVPLENGDEVIGVLDFAEREKPKRFLEDDKRLATLFAHQASIAINNARLFERAQREIAERVQAEAALKEREEQLRYDALHDGLTGLPNRALLLDRLGQAIARSRRRKDFLFALIFLDLDRFKVINDSLGHVAGDELLIAVGSRIESCLRGTDTVARLGGDEFVIYLEDIKHNDDATDIASRVLASLKLPFTLKAREVHVTASMGIVLSAVGYERAEEMLRDADIALYRAKGLGKAKYEIFDTSLRGEAMARLVLENDLHDALVRKELVLEYQPIVDLANNRPVGFEALVRWIHPVRGLVSPIHFIPVAEETGLIVQLGKWVLLEACSKMREWQEERLAGEDMTMSVNISPRQFMQPDLVRQLGFVISDTGLNPRSLSLEITEGILVSDVELSIGILGSLHEMGVSIQLDDFGTDYSSLSYLQAIQVDAIKIDRSFVSRMLHAKKTAGIVRAIVSLAAELGMETIAEGIETEEQKEALKALNCRYGQGFLIARPMSSDSVRDFLAAHAR